METLSALLAICAGNSPVHGEFPAQRPVTRSFDVYFDMHPNKRLSKHSWGWWFETPSYPLWRHWNASDAYISVSKLCYYCVQIMACRLFRQAPNHYLYQYWFIDHWTIGNKLQGNLNKYKSVFLHENAHEIYRLQNHGLNMFIHCGLVTPYGVVVNIDGTKPLPKVM